MFQIFQKMLLRNWVKSSIVAVLQPVDCKHATLIKRNRATEHINAPKNISTEL